MEDEKVLAEVGKFLREERKKLGWSVFKVAKAIGISGNYLSQIERGKLTPSDSVLYSISEFYNKEPSEIFSLYNKIYSEDIKEMLSIPSIKRLLLEMSLDKRLTKEEKEEIGNQMYEIMMNLISKKE